MKSLNIFFALLVYTVVAKPLPASSYSTQSHWNQLPSLSSPRQEHSVAALDTSVYIVGGHTTILAGVFSVPDLTSMEAYSTLTREWKSVAPIPIPLDHGNIAAVNGKLYILGGLTPLANNLTRDPFEDAFVYCPSSDRWTRIPSMPAGTGRGAAAVGVWKQHILLAGGLDVFDLATGVQLSVATVSAYDTVSKTWSKLPDLPEARDHVGGGVVGDTFFVVGGRKDGNWNEKGTVYALDLKAKTKRWVSKTSMPTPRGGLAAAVVGDKIYTFGGEGDPAIVKPVGVFDNVEVYDTKTDRWGELEKMAYPRHGTNAAAVGGKIYIPGGGNVTAAGPVSVFDVFTP